MLSALHSQYHACWCTGDLRSQCISRHGIDPQTGIFPLQHRLWKTLWVRIWLFVGLCVFKSKLIAALWCIYASMNWLINGSDNSLSPTSGLLTGFCSRENVLEICSSKLLSKWSYLNIFKQQNFSFFSVWKHGRKNLLFHLTWGIDHDNTKKQWA